MRKRQIVVVTAVVAVLACLGVYLVLDNLDRGLARRLRADACTVRTSTEVTLEPAQAANAATIAAVGLRRGLPLRAVTVALATAMQESKLENLSEGDRDSVGLFQQRPSQGWGSPEQIADPRFAAGEFYTALLKIRGWQAMDVAAAAQAVQRSALPDAYGRWVDEATALATAFDGDTGGALACFVKGQPVQRGAAATATLTRMLRLDWGDAVETRTTGPTTLLLATPAQQTGWRYAHWLVAHAQEQGIKRVRFQDRVWTATEGTWTRTTTNPRSTVEAVVAETWS